MLKDRSEKLAGVVDFGFYLFNLLNGLSLGVLMCGPVSLLDALLHSAILPHAASSSFSSSGEVSYFCHFIRGNNVGFERQEIYFDFQTFRQVFFLKIVYSSEKCSYFIFL